MLKEFHLKAKFDEANEKVGLARSISVMPGDTITMEAYAKYLDPNTNNWTAALSGLVQAIASGSGAGTSFIDGPSYSSADATPPWIGGDGRTTSHDGAPLASMNYVFIGRDFDPLSIEKNFTPITTEAMEDGTNRPHQKLTITYVAKTAGYMYIYLANDSETANPKDVFFDDFTVTQTKSPVVQADDYYPFGLAFNSYQRENSVENRYLYNQGTGEKTFKTERVYDLGLNVDLSRDRTYDYITGRWWQVDPKADKEAQEVWSPYNYSFNNPIRYNDPKGDCPLCFIVLGNFVKGAAIEYASQVAANIVKDQKVSFSAFRNVDVADIAVAGVTDAFTFGAGKSAKIAKEVGSELVKALVDVNKTNDGIKVETIANGKSAIKIGADLASSVVNTPIKGSISKDAVGNTQLAISKVVEGGLKTLANAPKEPIKNLLEDKLKKK